MTSPRAFTADECRDQFLGLVKEYVRYWEKDSRATTTREKLEGLAFSLLVILDGESAAAPGFTVTPNPHPDDRQYRIDHGDNWWPDDVDIAGGLHEHFHMTK